MGRVAAVVVLVYLVLFGALACDKEKAKKAAKVAASQVSQSIEAVDQSQILVRAQDFLRAVELRDLISLKKFCFDGSGEYLAIMSCYYNAFAIEDSQGVQAAARFLLDETGKTDVSSPKAKALKLLSNGLQAKGSLRSRELAGLILVFALEQKYPHGGGALGAFLAEKLHLLPATRPVIASTLPATTATTIAPEEASATPRSR